MLIQSFLTHRWININLTAYRCVSSVSQQCECLSVSFQSVSVTLEVRVETGGSSRTSAICFLSQLLFCQSVTDLTVSRTVTTTFLFVQTACDWEEGSASWDWACVCVCLLSLSHQCLLFACYHYKRLRFSACSGFARACSHTCCSSSDVCVCVVFLVCVRLCVSPIKNNSLGHLTERLQTTSITW